MNLEERFNQARELLLSVERPLFLFDDDPDGLASFILLYKFVKCGKGLAIKGAQIQASHKKFVENYQPDLIVLLDKALVQEEFFENNHTRILWIDHHPLQHPPKNTLYINSLMQGHNKPTSHLCYQITKQDPWIAVVGIVSDWQLPDKDLWEQTTDILPTETTDPQSALYNSLAGKLAQIFAFNLKGKTNEILSSIKMLTRVTNPQQILNQETAQTRLLIKRYEEKKEEYESLKQKVVVDEQDPLLLFVYQDDNNSYTTDLSNELLFKFPDKCIIIARTRNEQYVCSLRYAKANLEKILQEILLQTGGSGGGHENACGAQIPQEQWETFLKKLREKISQ